MAVERQPTESALPSFSLQHDRRPVRVTAAHCFEPDTLRRGLNAQRRVEDQNANLSTQESSVGHLTLDLSQAVLDRGYGRVPAFN